MKNEGRRTAQNIPATDQQNHLQEALSTLESLFDDHFECAICLETFSSPNVIPDCLHRFCNACIKGSIQRCGNECPTCKAKITISKRCVKKDQLLEDVVSRQIMLCYFLILLVLILVLLHPDHHHDVLCVIYAMCAL
jgi:hypothetical protein